MKPDDIQQVLARLEKSDVTECVIEHGVETLRIRLDRTTVFASMENRHDVPRVATSVKPKTVMVRTPATGIFRKTHPLAVGEHVSNASVRNGEHLGYLEVDSVFCAVVAPADGVPQADLLTEGAVIGYGRPVVELRVNLLEPLHGRRV